MTNDNVCVEVVDLTGRIYEVFFWCEEKEREKKNNVMEGCVDQHAALQSTV